MHRPPEVRAGRLAVVDACPYGRRGLAALLQRTHRPAPDDAVLTAATQAALPSATADTDCLMVRLSPSPLTALLQLLSLADTVRRLHVRHLVVLSVFATAAVTALLAAGGLSCPVTLLPARAGLEWLDDRLTRGATCSPVLPAAVPLSDTERRALCHSLAAETAQTQARRQGLSPKTVYHARMRALRKLGVRHLRALVNRLDAAREAPPSMTAGAPAPASRTGAPRPAGPSSLTQGEHHHAQVTRRVAGRPPEGR
ncbi:hypothetical protein FOT62_24645 [Serratia marcescens]|uniref:HTH luxR-type domain-containing protein n=2 Tax=Serratia TaxID=613 RepID=A0A5C7BTN5_SERMA|nr:hypothetical protein [Serratia marcescens]TXE24598.1 hypothetical protein FOT62_24645 [Serratia marcescens]TXE53321.1 hypothetical protein FOT56_27080 [Serratia marcescens]